MEVFLLPFLSVLCISLTSTDEEGIQKLDSRHYVWKVILQKFVRVHFIQGVISSLLLPCLAGRSNGNLGIQYVEHGI